MILAKPKRNSLLNPKRAGSGVKINEPDQPGIASYIDPAPLGLDGIMLANIMGMQREQLF